MRLGFCFFAARNNVVLGKPTWPYPRQALQSNVQGFVRVEFTVDTNGKIKGFKVLKEENVNFFRDAVFDSISSAKFHPAVVDGSPVEQQLVYEISFVIN
jgi:protein TonB